MIVPSQDKLSILASMALKSDTRHSSLGAPSRMERDFLNLRKYSPSFSFRNEINDRPPNKIVVFRGDESDGFIESGSKKRTWCGERDKVSLPRQHFKKQRKISDELPSIISNDEEGSLGSRRRRTHDTTCMEPPPKLAKGVYFGNRVNTGPKPTNSGIMMVRNYTNAGSFASRCIPLVHPSLQENLSNGVGKQKLHPLCTKVVLYIGGISQS
jgi:hypothetical protein